MNKYETAIKTISDIYIEYLTSDTDTVNLSSYDKALLDVHTVLEQSLQENDKRDKMRCENCNWFEKEKYFLDDEAPIIEQTYYSCNFYGDYVPEGIPVEINHFCSHFEPKEKEKARHHHVK